MKDPYPLVIYPKFEFHFMLTDPEEREGVYEGVFINDLVAKNLLLTLNQVDNFGEEGIYPSGGYLYVYVKGTTTDAVFSSYETNLVHFFVYKKVSVNGSVQKFLLLKKEVFISPSL